MKVGEYDIAKDIDPAVLEAATQRRREKQNLRLGVIGGVVGALLGCILWALVTVITKHEYTALAWPVGIMAGFGVRFLGRGVDKVFGVVGMLFAIVGVALGKVVAIVALAMIQNGFPIGQVMSAMSLNMVVTILKESFRFFDLIVYAVAIYFGYRTAMLQFLVEDLVKLKNSGNLE